MTAVCSLVSLSCNRRRAFRYTPGIFEKNDGVGSEQEENVDGSPVSPVSPVLRYLAKTSSSEWNSSDDLAGPLSEQEEADAFGHTDAFSHHHPPPLPPKSFGPALSHTTLIRRWIETPAEHRFSSDASSKSGSSDQDRNDLSASESDERLPSPNPGHGDGTHSPGLTEMALPTTYFSVDSCMTDSYRAKYHKRPAHLKAEDRASSGESDVEGRLPVPDVQPPELSKSRSQLGTNDVTICVTLKKQNFLHMSL